MQSVKWQGRMLRALAPLLWRGQALRWQLTGAHVLGVKMLLVREGEVMLVRQTYRPGWFLPGGGMKRGETILQAGSREAFEEVGAQVQEAEFVGLYTKRQGRATNHLAVLASRSFVLEPRDDWEVAEACFFPLDDLPRGLAPGDRRCIERYAAGVREPLGPW